MKKTKLVSLNVLSFSTSLSEFEKATINGGNGSFDCDQNNLNGGSGINRCSALGPQYCSSSGEYENEESAIPVFCATGNDGLCENVYSKNGECTGIQGVCNDNYTKTGC